MAWHPVITEQRRRRDFRILFFVLSLVQIGACGFVLYRGMSILIHYGLTREDAPPIAFLVSYAFLGISAIVAIAYRKPFGYYLESIWLGFIAFSAYSTVPTDYSLPTIGKSLACGAVFLVSLHFWGLAKRRRLELRDGYPSL